MVPLSTSGLTVSGHDVLFRVERATATSHRWRGSAAALRGMSGAAPQGPRGLPFPDQSIDAAFEHLLFLHLANPARAGTFLCLPTSTVMISRPAAAHK